MARLPAPWPRNFRPTPGNFGAQFQTLARAIGTNGATLVGTTTTTVYLPVPRAQAFSVVNAAFVGPTPAAGSGTITAQLIKEAAGAPSTTTVQTAANSLTSSFVTSYNVEAPITAIGASRSCGIGDNLRWDIVAAGTVGTAPELLLICEIALTTP